MGLQVVSKISNNGIYRILVSVSVRYLLKINTAAKNEIRNPGGLPAARGTHMLSAFATGQHL
jgi:hypothetical protein